VNEHTYQKLEFDEVRAAVARACSCSLGRHLAETLTPSTRPAVVRQWLSQVSELAAAIDLVSYPPFGGIHDIHEEVNAASFPSPLEGDRLAKVAETLEGTVHIRSWFARLGERAPQLAAIGERIGDFEKLAAVINESVDPRGNVRDTASSRLSGIRVTIERTKDSLRSVCDRLVKQVGVRAMLAYQGVTFHEDRMVLPLKSEYHGRIKGIVHRSSESGSTLFVEPAESVELNNTLTRLRDEEQKEITRILRELCRKITAHREPIISTLRAVAVLDLIAGEVSLRPASQVHLPRGQRGRPAGAARRATPGAAGGL
jgi:DNA mismatch repair protein MutS2